MQSIRLKKKIITLSFFAFIIFFFYGYHSKGRIRQRISANIPSTLQIRNDSISGVYITVDGVFILPEGNDYSSIVIPKSVFDGYSYVSVKSNSEFSTRVHILKEEPKGVNDHVLYSDYYQESILVGEKIKLDIAIPDDAAYICILNSVEGHNNTPDSIILYSADALCHQYAEIEQNPLTLDGNIFIHKFLHWNLGHFSNGQYPYSTITETNYKDRLKAFRVFFNTYCSECHLLFNEYDESFAQIGEQAVKTDTVLFNMRKTRQVFPRSTSTGYNRLAAFWNEGLLGYRYGVFESMKGVKNSNGTLEYGTGYCLSTYAIGKDSLYVMSLHVPNKIKRGEYDALFKEIVSLCSNLDNCVLVGDFNRSSFTDFTAFTDAGFKILNDNSVTYPSTGYILDWVLYRCNNVTLSDFRVFTEAVDGNGDLLSDHLPVSFTVKYN